MRGESWDSTQEVEISHARTSFRWEERQRQPGDQDLTVVRLSSKQGLPQRSTRLGVPYAGSRHPLTNERDISCARLSQCQYWGTDNEVRYKVHHDISYNSHEDSTHRTIPPHTSPSPSLPLSPQVDRAEKTFNVNIITCREIWTILITAGVCWGYCWRWDEKKKTFGPWWW